MRAAMMFQCHKGKALQITTRALSSINPAGVDTSADKVSLVQGASRGNNAGSEVPLYQCAIILSTFANISFLFPTTASNAKLFSPVILFLS